MFLSGNGCKIAPAHSRYLFFGELTDGIPLICKELFHSLQCLDLVVFERPFGFVFEGSLEEIQRILCIVRVIA